MSDTTHAIIPRKGPELGFEAGLPRHWLGGDPFKSRFFDAMSCLFPEGEKFFIACVRDFRDQVTDPVLQAQVKDFIYQEGQHGMVHTRFNDHLKSQGVAVDRILAFQIRIMFGFFRKRFSPAFTLGQTAAAEHTVGYALVEHQRLGRFDPDRARALGVPEGPLWGQIHKGKIVTLPSGETVAPEQLVGPTRSGRTIVFSGDTRPHPAVIVAARGADLLVHEATFGQEEQTRAVETGHSTAREAALVAQEAGVKRLVLTHISARYTRDAPELLAEAQEVFQEVQVARDGLTIEVPFAERP